MHEEHEEKEELDIIKFYGYVPKCCGETATIKFVPRGDVDPSYNSPCYWATGKAVDEEEWKEEGPAKVCSAEAQSDAQTYTNRFRLGSVLVACMAWMVLLVAVHDCAHSLLGKHGHHGHGHGHDDHGDHGHDGHGHDGHGHGHDGHGDGHGGHGDGHGGHGDGHGGGHGHSDGAHGGDKHHEAKADAGKTH